MIILPYNNILGIPIFISILSQISSAQTPNRDFPESNAHLVLTGDPGTTVDSSNTWEPRTTGESRNTWEPRTTGDSWGTWDSSSPWDSRSPGDPVITWDSASTGEPRTSGDSRRTEQFEPPTWDTDESAFTGATRDSLFSTLFDPSTDPGGSSGPASNSLFEYSVAPGINLVPTHTESPSDISAGTPPTSLWDSHPREGHFLGGKGLILSNPLNLLGHTTLHVRTCSHGSLISQSFPNGPVDQGSVDLALDENGMLELRVVAGQFNRTIVLPDEKLNDNQWHRVSIKFDPSSTSLRLGADEAFVDANNATLWPEGLRNLGSLVQSASHSMLIGEGFQGCLLQGINTRFRANSTAAPAAVQWGSCSLPVNKNCSGYDTDPCFQDPCGQNGVCVPDGMSYTCSCFSRYQGLNCQNDTGPLCQRAENQCQNDGVCQEEEPATGTRCVCPFGFMGVRCESTVESFCAGNPCLNNGTCVLSEHKDAYTCDCPREFEGEHCEAAKDFCSADPCLHGGTCSTSPGGFSCDCSQTGYTGERCQTDVDECQALGQPCSNGGTCLDFYGGYECACADGFTGNHCSQVLLSRSEHLQCPPGGNCESRSASVCEGIICPENSVCVDRDGSHLCQCQAGYTGLPPTCLKLDFCLSLPCLNGATCFDGSDAYTCICPVGFTGQNCETNIDDCENVYCENGGSCLDGINNSSCLCVEGFSGFFCERNTNECDQNVCVNAVRCTDLSGDYRCDCEPGWTGKNCDRNVDECAASPCLNDGVCTDAEGSFTCRCPAGFEGDLCEININECESNPCQNNASCIDGSNNYTCVCEQQHMGRNCEMSYDACSFEPCKNNATCQSTLGQQEFVCDCQSGFEGTDCSVNIDDCVGVFCDQGKVCFDLVDDHECSCPVGFDGDLCAHEIDECAPGPCLHGATCSDLVGNYSCQCPVGYTGMNCERDVDECEDKPCLHGICLNTEGAFECYCRPGYSGENCSLDIDECLSQPCQNGATCLDGVNAYECLCADGFTGANCQINIDECESDPCLNNGTCIDGVAEFFCQCVPGFTDSVCATNIDECEPIPCLNGGTCLDGINEYECLCEDTGFKGFNCEVNIDDCEYGPCQHGSNCTDLVKDYDCSCHAGYAGKNCEDDIPECASNPCQNGATCLEYSNETLYVLGVFTDFSYDSAEGFLCECILGFAGDFCEINIDDCENNPCMHGRCIDGINAYECQCHPGYEGDRCETEIDECQRYEPCVHGSCFDQVADYQCDCFNETEYGGKNCSILLLGCDGVVCENEGRCTPLLIDESLHDYQCHCLPGFTGRNCELSTVFSLDGNGYLILNSPGSKGYDMSLNFRTTLPSVILAVGQGEEHYFTLVLHEGRIRLQSSFLNRYNGTYSGSDLNDGEWKHIKMMVNETHCMLYANNDLTIRPLSTSIPSFDATFLGGVTSNLRILANEPSFTGCIRDVKLNDTKIIPSTLPQGLKVNVTEQCLREPQCEPNPCQHDGKCTDLWSSFQCKCQRPYLGETCRMSFTPATFRHEQTTDSLAVINIPIQDQRTFQKRVDVSMMLRTRHENGFIFYLGSPIDTANDLGDEGNSYILAELIRGKIVVKVRLGAEEEVFETSKSTIADGKLYLLNVERDERRIQVKVNDELYLNDTLAGLGGDDDLQAQILYLGGLPSVSNRVKRQLGVSTSPTPIQKTHFKGIIQDFRLTSGNETRLIELFPLERIPGEVFELPGAALRPDSTVGLLSGTVSDDTCSSDPCLEGGTCEVTFNDFTCTCPTGFKGKICDELEYCAMFQCPAGSTCVNLIDGYECLDNVTFDGHSSSISYKPHFTNASQLTTFSTTFKSKVGGVIVSSIWGDVGFWLGLAPSGDIWIQGINATTTTNVYRQAGSSTVDGEWHHLQVLFDDSEIQVTLDNVTMATVSNAETNFRLDSLIRNAGVTLGSLGSLSNMPTINLQLDPDSSRNSNIEMASYFRGCLSDSRVGPMLLPVHYPKELVNNTAVNVFKIQSMSNANLGCEVCFQRECFNGGVCRNPNSTFDCSCPPGFEGSLCEIDVDECLDNACRNGATCVDGIYSYSCECPPGYTGDLCETEIDECESAPCQNGGTCVDEIAAFVCRCLEPYAGPTCSQMRPGPCSGQESEECREVNECQSQPGICRNEGVCVDTLFSFACECAPQYCGKYCLLDNPCVANKVNCTNGFCQHACNEFADSAEITCRCDEGWEGDFCEKEVTLSAEYLSIIVGVVVGLMLLIAVVGFIIFLMMAKKKRETSGTYSPSKQEFYSPRVEMGNMMKPPPEERLI